MVLNIRKLCVGVDTVEELEAWQRHRLEVQGSIGHVTRMWPKRIDEVLEGGSLYWIIKGVMRARQPIIGFEEWHGGEPGEKPRCRIVLDPVLVLTEPWPHRPFQGWRYLPGSEAPPDLSAREEGQMPPDLAAELRQLGAW